MEPEAKRARTMTESWVPVSADSHFPLQNLPFGVFKRDQGVARIGVAIGESVLDLKVLASETGLLDSLGDDVKQSLAGKTLNAFMGLEKAKWDATRAKLQELLAKDGNNPSLCDDQALRLRALHPQDSVEMLMPCDIGDYTDFYASRQHATNVGSLFRDPKNALLPNWLHLPVGYHGRASSIVVSGTGVRRPCGQLQKDATDPSQGSIYGPCRAMDFELEMACLYGGKGNSLGEPLSVDQVGQHVFGFVLMNDWSARDIQKWEYVPLGPFGAKNFATTISPWIVTTAALEPFRCKTSSGEQVDPVPLPYLRQENPTTFDITLDVSLKAQDIGAEPFRVCRTNYRNMYWTHDQQIAHHTVTGCNLRPGDLFGSGTISGDDRSAYGSMLEITWKGANPLEIKPGVERKFLKDGDTVIMTGFCQGDGFRVGFGTCQGTVLPAKPQ